ncbi:hypothetical protein ACMSWW_001137 [Cronobacter turicensis]
MSEISEKRVEALASNILECHDVKPSEVKALAGLALPALRDRAEPVAYIIQDAEARDRGRPGFLSYDASISDQDINEYEISITPLYTAPPAPVVASFEEWCQRNGQKPVGWVREAMKEAYEGCRAAMLQPVSQPYKLPGKEW